jgi:hypothetical protein
VQRIYGNQPQADETGVFSTGAAQDRWFSHLSVTVPKEAASRE